MKEALYIAQDQRTGEWLPLGLTKHPRKVLLERTGFKSCEIMYCDLLSGGYQRIGYVVGPHWYRVYEIKHPEDWKPQGRVAA